MTSVKMQYAAKWLSWVTIPAGAGWAFAVGVIEQGKAGRFRVRVAKGKMKIVGPGELPITQQAKFNLKASDWPALRDAIDQAIADLGSARTEDGVTTFGKEDEIEAGGSGKGWDYLRNRTKGE